MNDPLVIAGGPSAVNSELMSDFIDLFIDENQNRNRSIAKKSDT